MLDCLLKELDEADNSLSGRAADMLRAQAKQLQEQSASLTKERKLRSLAELKARVYWEGFYQTFKNLAAVKSQS